MDKFEIDLYFEIKIIQETMQSQLDNSRYAQSILSSSTRRDVLWNVSEPGDPYDIKKYV
jgi:hypothetical protein